MFLRSCAHAADIKAAAGFSHRYEKEFIYDPVTICDAVAGDPVRAPGSGLDMLITSPSKIVLLFTT